MITIELPVVNYLKSYLETIYGESYQVSIKNDLGILILNTLSKQADYYHYKSSDQEKRTDKFIIRISFSYFEKYGCTISENKISQIHKSLDNAFRMNLFRAAIINKHHFGINYKESINATLKSYNIPEDQLSYSTIRRSFNRHKDEIQAQLCANGQI